MTDLVLGKEVDLTDFQKAAIVLSLKKMFQGNHFDITVVREAGEILGVTYKMGGPDFNALRLMHCINWGTMGAAMSKEVQRKTLDILGINLAVIEPYEEPAEKGDISVWKKLLSFK